MKVLHDRRVYGVCVIGLVFLASQGCGDDDQSTDGVSETDAGGGVNEAGGAAPSGRAGAGGRPAGGASGSVAGESGGAAGATAAGAGASVGGRGGSAGSGGGGGGTDPDSDAGVDDDAGIDEGEAGSGGAGEAGSGGTGEAGSGGAGEAGSGGTGEAGSGSEDGRCETRGGVTCPEDQFCNFAPDAACGALDAGGVCVDKPEICLAIFAPVCGCDNRTYGNDCEANASGISVKREGLCSVEECAEAGGRAVFSDGASTPECEQGEEGWNVSGGIEPVLCCVGEEPSGETCGGIASLECADEEFCNYEPEAGGQGCDGTIADAGGVCEARPTVCTREYQPVCGCDRKSYPNACDAHASGISILHDDACNELDCDAVGGRVVFGIGPAPMCDPGETEHTSVIDSSGAIPIEGAICCVESTM